jgi:DOPA 4,5-dioxygenase
MMKEDAIEIVSFHAPMCFDTAVRDTAERVREGLARFEVQLGRWHDKPIAPPLSDVLAFLPSQFGQVVPWLMLHREELNILVHSETGMMCQTILYILCAGRKTRVECRSPAT